MTISGPQTMAAARLGNPPEAGDASAPEPGSRGALERERRTLVDEREGHVYHLGGLAFELHRRGLLPDGVMRLRAGNVEQTDDRIREIDASLDAIEAEREERRRVEKERRAASAPGTAPEPAGVCSSCATAFQSEARFCWSCGTPVSITRAAAEPAAPTVDTP